MEQTMKPEDGNSMAFKIDLNEAPLFSSPSPRCQANGTGTGSSDAKHVLFDINALPCEEEPYGQELSRTQDPASTGSGSSNSNATVATSSNLLFEKNHFDLVKSFGILNSRDTIFGGTNLKETDPYSMASARGAQNPGEKLLQALREFIRDNKGILEDGWHVDFFYCQKRCKTFAVYCSPDGNRFESMFDVACHLGLVSNSLSFLSQNASDRLASLHGSHKRRKEFLTFSITEDLKESQEYLEGSLSEEVPLGIENISAEPSRLGNDFRVSSSGETGCCDSSHCKDRFPVQFGDFFVLTLGEVDSHPSYHSTTQIWPVGYKSSWHDRITGSLFVCHVSDGGDSGPVFRVQRYPCSTQPIPVGSTFLSLPSLGTDFNKIDTNLDMDDIGDIQMLLSDISLPSLDLNIFSGDRNTLDEVSNSQSISGLQTDSNCYSLNFWKSEYSNGIVYDDIGEFLVEGRSSSSVWRMVSQKIAHACHEVYKRTGACKFFCRHDAHGWRSSCLVLKDVKSIESTDSLAKFCQMFGPLDVTCNIQSNDELTASCEAMVKWLDQDRFGLDIEFVQEMIEQLPSVHTCSGYKFLNERSDGSNSRTVGSGFLLAKRKCDVQGEKETDDAFVVCKKPKRPAVENPPLKEFPPPGKPLSYKLPTGLVGDVLQSWELLWRFSEVLGLEEPLSFKELEEELTECCPFTLRRSSASTVNVKSQHTSITKETESLRVGGKVRQAPGNCSICTGETLAKAHCSLLKVLLAELQSKLLAFVDPAPESGESKSRKKRKKDSDNLTCAKRTMLDLLPINELTWPELARRYVLTASSIGGNLDSVETVNRESCKVFHCFQGDSGGVNSSLLGVAAMEADALLLAEATRQIFGSSKSLDDHSNVNSNESDAHNASKSVKVNDGEIPDWVQVLEPVRKLPTNVGARIRKCINEALHRNPPEWAKKILEHSISREVYKGNASGPTKRAVLSILADVHGENLQQKPNKKRKNKYSNSFSEVIMKQCRKVLRQSASADDEKVFCNLLGRTFSHISGNDEEGLLGFPSMVSRPLDFRTIDLRLAFGAYGGSHEAFLEDVREVWHHIRTAYTDQSDLVNLAERLSQNFEALYEKEVPTFVRKLMDYATLDSLSSEAEKEIEDILERASELPKAPWDEGVCKVCGVDKDDDNVLLCDKCDSGYHTYCLNPPLSRIPEGNWYCPSCVTGNRISQATLQVPGFMSQFSKKNYRGEFTQGFLKALTNLGTNMEMKEYWECTMEERIFLLKFLGDEALSSAKIREHLDQCASKASDLQQKLHSLSTECRSLKFREEILTEKVPELNKSVLNGVGKSGAAVMAAVLPDHNKLMGQTRSRLCLPLSSDWVHLEDGLHWNKLNDFTTEPIWFYSKGVPERHFLSRTQFTKTHVSEGQVNQQSGKDKRVKFESSSHMLPFFGKDELPWQNKCLTLPEQDTCEDGERAVNPLGHISSGTSGSLVADHACSPPMNSGSLLTVSDNFIQPDLNHLQSYNLEASYIKNKISILQDSIACLEKQLQEVSLRKECLGRDSAGRFYWAFCKPGTSPWVVVDGTITEQQRSIKEHRKMPNNLNISSFPVVMENLCKFRESNVPCLHTSELADGIPISSQWFSYRSRADLEELIRWLKENDPEGRELLDSLLRLKFRYGDSTKVGNHVSNACQSISNPIEYDESASCSALETKALMVLEKFYGSFWEPDVFDIPMKLGQNAEVISKDRMCRCECLEPVWPSRNHCHLCHWSFFTRCELMEHNYGKCSSGACASLGSKVKVNVQKEKGMMGADHDKCSDKPRIGKAGSIGHEIDFRLVGIPKDLTSPYDIEEISSKFITKNSNKELVKEIGLLGSNGIPSFLPCESPCLNDPTLKLSSCLKNEVNQSDKSLSTETWLQSPQANVVGSKRHVINSNDTTNSCAARDIYEDARKSKFKNEKKHKSSLKFSYLKLGDAGFSLTCDASRREPVGRGAQILRQLKINLLDMDAALPNEAMKPSKACLERRCVWRAFVKSSKSVYEMVQATVVFENMIKTEYLRNEWSYWSSLSAAAKIATVSSLALRIYTLDAAIIYDNPLPISPTENAGSGNTRDNNNSSLHGDPTCNSKQSSKPIPRTHNPSNPTDNSKPESRWGNKRKDSEG